MGEYIALGLLSPDICASCGHRTDGDHDIDSDVMAFATIVITE